MSIVQPLLLLLAISPSTAWHFFFFKQYFIELWQYHHLANLIFHQPDSQHRCALSAPKRENSLILPLIEILEASLPGIEAPALVNASLLFAQQRWRWLGRECFGEILKSIHYILVPTRIIWVLNECSQCQLAICSTEVKMIGLWRFLEKYSWCPFTIFSTSQSFEYCSQRQLAICSTGWRWLAHDGFRVLLKRINRGKGE